MKHRIQIDFDIEADSHTDAFRKVNDWMIALHSDEYPKDILDFVVLEDDGEACAECNYDQSDNRCVCSGGTDMDIWCPIHD